LIRVQGLSFSYPTRRRSALRDVSFELPGGQITLVSGPTGSGKSTLGLALCGAIPGVIPGRLQGSVEIDGTHMGAGPVRRTTHLVGFLMQNVEHQVFTDMTEDEVAFGMENLGYPRAEMEDAVTEALDLIDGQHLRGRRLETLSAGERQRVMLAAQLCLGQRVVILDEPLAYLDRSGVARLLSLLENLSREGKTFVVLEHRRDLMLPFAARELRLEDGALSNREPQCPAFPRIENGGDEGPVRLAVENLSFRWDKNPLLRDVSFELRAGQSVVVLGSNGSGKTTLLKLILGLQKPDSGHVLNCSFDTRETTPQQLASKAALVLQNPDHQLFLPTVKEEILWGTAASQHALHEMKALRLEDLSARHPHSLSMGQKRRVTLASALARRPELLLLDEPTVGQDDDSLALVLRRLGQFVEDGGALLVATHDRRAAEALGGQGMILSRERAQMGGEELVESFFGWSGEPRKTPTFSSM